ncbi:MAG: citrate synthase [Mariprofundaceae bacterium]|nr:citrate synthase [Mariprofundaceae bacterium]
MTTHTYVPGLAGVPVTESEISYVDGQKGSLEYCGIDIEVLAEKSSFEETCYLLLHRRLPNREEFDQFNFSLSHHRRIKYSIRDMIKCYPDAAHPMDALQAGSAALGMFYPLADQEDQVQAQKDLDMAAIRLIAKMPTLVAAHARMRVGDDPITPRDDLSHAANFLYMLRGEEPSALEARIMDVAFIVHAEHTINASTFSAMVTASTLANAYTVISSAIGTLSGPLHGGANEDVLNMLDDIDHVADTEAYMYQKLKRKEKIPGLGHRIYKTKDPRATLLQKLYFELSTQGGPDLNYEKAKIIESVAAEILGPKGICPNVDFYSGTVYRKLGISPDLFTPIFAVARVAGWLAHWKEQLGNSRIYRPQQIYIGQHRQAYTPIEQR